MGEIPGPGRTDSWEKEGGLMRKGPWSQEILGAWSQEILGAVASTANGHITFSHSISYM